MLIHATVKPGSRKGPFAEKQADGSYLIYVQERAVEGKANDAAVRVIAEELDISPSRVTIVRGKKSRHKAFSVE